MPSHILEGVRVLDFTHQVAGPFCTMLLGDCGANVIKIEGPEIAEAARDYPMLGISVFLALNRNKRSIVVDAKTKEGQNIIYQLVRKSDVFVENFSPGVAKKLGVDYETLSDLNKKLIYCSISGFGSSGPYKNRLAWDPLVQAMSGIMSVTGEPDGEPVRVGVSMTDLSAGLFAAFGIVLALLDREKTGLGQYIEVSLYETAVSYMSYWIVYYSLTGQIPTKVGSGWPPFCPYQVFKTKDSWVFIGVNNNDSWRALLQALHLQHLENDKRFKNNHDRVRNKNELIPILQSILLGMTTKDVVENLVSLGVASGPVSNVQELVNDPHLNERGAIFEMKHDNLNYKTVRTPVRMRTDPPKIPPPRPGNATEEILLELGYDITAIKDLRNKGVIY
jgi:formyl-CoA transferase/CoA:oxalate CoA-transferase